MLWNNREGSGMRTAIMKAYIAAINPTMLVMAGTAVWHTHKAALLQGRLRIKPNNISTSIRMYTRSTTLCQQT